MPFALVLVASVGSVCMVGCAEGPMWRTGYLSPWARQQWSSEEEIAATLFAKRQRLRRVVEQAKDAGEAQQQEASQFLAEIVQKDPVLLLRIEATRLLAELPNDISARALQIASSDPDRDVRLAAVHSWQQRGDDRALQMLGKMLREDADFDVRMRAAGALGRFEQPEAVQVLSSVLADPDPAMQIKAAESLARVTGEDFGNDIRAWQNFTKSRLGQSGDQADANNGQQFK